MPNNQGFETSDIVQESNSLSANMSVIDNVEAYDDPEMLLRRTSPKFLINNSAYFQVQVITAILGQDFTSEHHMICVLFTKRRADDKNMYKIELTIKEFSIKHTCFTSDNYMWHLIHEINKEKFSFNLHVVMETVPSIKSCETSFAELHDDTELTDFELRGEDGSIRVHRVVLALASPVFRRMLSGGAWRETSAGQVEIPGISKSTLEHFKTYIYLKELPEHGLEQLLLLSSCYIMPDLENNCIYNLVQNLRAEDVYELIEFAIINKVTKLLVAVLECVQKGAVKVADINDHVTGTGVGAPDTEGAENSVASANS